MILVIICALIFGVFFFKILYEYLLSVSCGTVAVKLQPCHSQLTLYTYTIPNTVCSAPPDNEQVMLETFRGIDSQ
jgi:hypothetical protein